MADNNILINGYTFIYSVDQTGEIYYVDCPRHPTMKKFIDKNFKPTKDTADLEMMLEQATIDYEMEN